MKNLHTIDEILDFAIQNEQEAVDFYTRLAEMSNRPAVKSVFIDFAREEMLHKAKLIEIKEKGILELESEAIADLKISDYTDGVHASENMTYAEALIVAMKREKAAFKLYSVLAERTDSEFIKSVFLMLAQEESKHKLKFEIEYDEFVLREN